jgi:hypothetical protein
MTLPSDLNMFTSSMAWMGWTFSFLRVACSFLSSVPLVLETRLVFLRGVPLPLFLCCRLVNAPPFHVDLSIQAKG